jgi:hypothetical protein
VIYTINLLLSPKLRMSASVPQYPTTLCCVCLDSRSDIMYSFFFNSKEVYLCFSVFMHSNRQVSYTLARILLKDSRLWETQYGESEAG